jgi:ribonuclease R
LVTPNNIYSHDIIIPKRKLKGGKTDDKAIVKITQWPSAEHKDMLGEVVDILGATGDNDVEMNTILAQYGLPYIYPKNVEEAANQITGEITEKDLAEREDFRDVFTCTIDPKDAKDFDDALSFKELDKGLYQVGVHIADVSHYVKEGSVIDKEAYKRATSVYLVDRTIPMLPERLCNFICSLRPDEEKLAYSVIFNLDDEANIKAYRIVHTVIKSNRRYAYEEVQQILEYNGVIDGTGEPAPKAPKDGYKGENATILIMLDRLAKKLRANRFKNGSVKFDREELHFDVDEKGKPTRCYFKRSHDANKLIEEFMLLANKTVAESIGKVARAKKAKVLPYRVHDNPDPTKLETLREFVVKFGYKLKSTSTKGATARSLNKLMEEVSKKPESNMIQMVALRAMMKAKYSVHNIGHFGLAFDYYTHFTSPIRRYPDTLVHRLLTRYAEGGRSVNEKRYEELCEHCSEMELVAQSAERDSIKYKMVEFMGDKLGEVYDAHISGITSFGIYAEIDENHCEGMVPMRDLQDDYYDFDERNFCLIGRRRHHKYQLGDAIKIQVARTDLEKKQLDFTIYDENKKNKR